MLYCYRQLSFMGDACSLAIYMAPNCSCYHGRTPQAPYCHTFIRTKREPVNLWLSRDNLANFSAQLHPSLASVDIRRACIISCGALMAPLSHYEQEKSSIPGWKGTFNSRLTENNVQTPSVSVLLLNNIHSTSFVPYLFAYSALHSLRRQIHSPCKMSVPTQPYLCIHLLMHTSMTGMVCAHYWIYC